VFRLAVKNVWGHKLRLLLTGLGAVVGIAFLAGTLVFTDTIKSTFDSLFANVYKNTDAYVRSSESVDVGFGQTVRGRIPDSVVAQVQSVPGVKVASGSTSGAGRIIGTDGKPLGTDNGAPNFAGSTSAPELSPWKLAQGHMPQQPNDVVLDNASFKNGGFKLGDKVTVISQGGTRQFDLVGSVKFGSADSPGGATFALFTLPTAQEFVGRPGQIDAVEVKGDGSVSQRALADRIQKTMPTGVETLTGQEITKENQTTIQDALRFFNVLLLVFAGIAIFVGTFIIYNTFAITIAQRMRENALLRAIGAGRRQVLGGLVVEAIVVGIVASLTGFVLGIGLSVLLRAALRALGIDIPASGLVVLPRTLIVSLLVGTIITVISGVFPAWRGSKVPPVAAMRDVAVESTVVSKARLISGFVIGGLGALLLAIGLAGGNPIVFLGTPLIFVGLFILGPIVARPVARFLGWPLPRLRGVTGQLARENAMRNPKRTSRTAAALLVGVALVSGVTVLASSLKSYVRSVFEQQFNGDFVLRTNAQVGGLPLEAAQRMNQLPEVAAATGVGIGFGKVDRPSANGPHPQDGTLTLVDPATISKLFNLDFISGSASDLTDTGVLVSKRRAEADGLHIGSTFNITLLDGTPRPVTVQGIYNKRELAGDTTVSKGFYSKGGGDQFDFSVFVKTKPGVSEAAARAALETVAMDYPNGTLESRTEYINNQAKQIDQVVNLVYVLLALSIVIAVVGIIITLWLSVFERTRELGLVRAVGASRAQVRSSVHWESIITAVLGTVEGLVVGVLLGYATVVALRSQGLKSFSLPIGTLVVVLLLGVFVGWLASLLPAWRASRLNVLQAISYE
jgi:putative ABC transport system permease protein